MLRNISIASLQANFLLFLLSSAPAADIIIDKSVIDLTAAESRRADFHIANRGDKPREIVIEAFRVLKPGTAEETRQQFDNPREMGMLVTPGRFLLEPDGRRRVRLSFLQNPANEDLIYRLLVKPLPDEDTTTPKKSLIKVVFNYDLLVSYRPANPDSSYAVERTPDGIAFTNTGNSNFLLYSGQQCITKDTDCQALPSKRVYAGTQYRFDLDSSRPYVRFVMKGAGETRLLEYP